MTAISVGTYNMKCPAPWDKDPKHEWSYRSPLLFKLWRAHNPDILGAQEPVKHYLDDIAREFPEMERVGGGRDDGKDGGEFSPVFFRKERFTLLDSGTFWLSKTPEVPGSIYPDETHPRISTYAYLKDRISGHTIAFYNTHTSYVSVKICSAQIGIIAEHMKKNAPADAVRIITGDLNFEASSGALQPAFDAGLVNADDVCASPLDGLWNSATLYRLFPKSYPAEDIRQALRSNGGDFETVKKAFPELGMRIDHVLVSKNVYVRSCGVDGTTFDGLYPSDHMPKFATIEIPD